MGKREARRKKLTKHHRLPQSQGGTNSFPEGNVALLRGDRHEAWHKLFSNATAERICWLINHYYLDPRYKLVLVRRDE